MLIRFGIATIFVVMLSSVKCLLNQGTVSSGEDGQLVAELIRNVTRLTQDLDAAAAREQVNMAYLMTSNTRLHQSFVKLQETLEKERNQSIEHQSIADQQQRIDNLEKEHNHWKQSLAKLQETLQRERNQSMELRQEMNKTIADQQLRIEYLEKEIVEQNMTNTLQQEKVDTLESKNNETNIEQHRQRDEINTIGQRMNQSFGAYQVILHDVVDKYDHLVNLFNNGTRTLNQNVADLGRQFHYLSLSLLDVQRNYAAVNASLTGTYTMYFNTEGDLILLRYIQYFKIGLN